MIKVVFGKFPVDKTGPTQVLINVKVILIVAVFLTLARTIVQTLLFNDC